jgi:hypothetical protein
VIFTGQYCWGRGGSVSVVTKQRARGVRFDSRQRQGRNVFFYHRVQTVSGPHPSFHQIGVGDVLPGVKRLGREADHSPPSSAEVKECVELCLHLPNWRST